VRTAAAISNEDNVMKSKISRGPSYLEEAAVGEVDAEDEDLVLSVRAERNTDGLFCS